MPENTYSGDPLDAGWQYFDERPAASETVYATDPKPPGEVTTEGVPVPDSGARPVDASADDWPAIARAALAYRGEHGANSHYVQRAREWFDGGEFGSDG